MITRKTVFVLGAGAHCPYGLPDGNSLTKSIVQMLPDSTTVSTNEFSDQFFEAYSTHVADIRRKIAEFRNRLDQAGQNSIDSFLATFAHRETYPEIGKFAVAKLLLPLEFKTSFARITRIPDKDWLSYLFSYMQQGCLTSADEFIERNNATFVTFNYDRTLEYFFFHRLRYSYDLSATEALDKSKKISIVHVYGSLGNFEENLIVKRSFTPAEIRAAGSSIRLMYEDRNVHSEIESAKDALSQTDCVCFLGFSFDPDNLTRLELPAHCAGKALYASRYKMPDGEWGRVRAEFQQANFAHTDRDWDALTFLRETRALG
jgi:hypothetical protein